MREDHIGGGMARGLSLTLLSLLDEFKDVISRSNAVGEKAVYGV